jgi:hypothetical protein
MIDRCIGIDSLSEMRRRADVDVWDRDVPIIAPLEYSVQFALWQLAT